MAATRTSSDFLMFSSSLPGPSAKRSAHVRILRAPAMRSRRASPGQRIMLRTANRCDEFPSPHGFACAEDHIGYQKTITFFGLIIAFVRYTQAASFQRPLWVISGNFAKSGRYPLYPQKRTSVERVDMSALCQKHISDKLIYGNAAGRSLMWSVVAQEAD